MSARSSVRLAGPTRFVIAHARAVVAVFVLLAIAGGIFTGLNVRIDTSTTDMIAADVPFRRNAIAFDEAFPRFDQPIVAVLEAPAPEQAEAAAAALAARLRAMPDRFDAVEYLPAHPFFRRNGLLYLELEELERLSERLAAAQPLLAVLAADPTLRGLTAFLDLALGEIPPDVPLDDDLSHLLGAMAGVVDAVGEGRPAVLSWRRALDGEAADGPAREIVLAQPRLDHASLAPAGSTIGAVRDAAREAAPGTSAGVELRLTGDAVLQQEELLSVRSNALLAAALTTLGVAALLVIGLGSWRLIVATLVTLGIGLLLTAAGALLLIGRLNLISVTFAVLFVGLGVDFGIHLVLRFREALAAGAPRVQALVVAVPGVAGALALSALCAALGFLAFVPTDYQGLAELGVISAGGMAIALGTSLTLLPALLAWFGPDREAPLREVETGTGAWLQRPKVVLPLTFAAALGAAFALPAVGFDFNPLNLKDPASESVGTFLRLAEDPATSPYNIDVVAPDAAAAAELGERLEALDAVGEVVSLASFVPPDQEAKLELIDSLAFFLGPVLEPAAAGGLDPAARQAAFARLLAVLEAFLEQRAVPAPAAAMLAEALERFGASGLGADRLRRLEDALLGTLLDLFERLGTALEAAPVGPDDLPEDLVERWRTEDGRHRLLVRPAEPIEGNDDLRAFADAVLEVEPSATGTPVIVREAGRAVIGAFATASWLALGAITLVLVLVLRRPLEVLMVLIPLVLAVLFTAASAVLLDLELNFANVIVLPLLLGLGVSGAIHVVLRAREGGRDQRVERTSTPRAVLFSALTTIASFGSLAVSQHRGLSSMGQLLTIAILWSLVCTLIVLPNLLALRQGPPGPAP